MPLYNCIAEAESTHKAKSKAPSLIRLKLSRAAPLSITVVIMLLSALLITEAVPTHQAYNPDVDEVLPIFRYTVSFGKA